MAVGEGVDVIGDQGPGTGDRVRVEKIRDYRDLRVWQRAMELVVESYSLAGELPSSKALGLSHQIRRAAVSVASNIAEGNGRTALGDYLRHLSIGNGSLLELETHTRIAQRLSYISTEREGHLLTLSREIGRMLGALIARLRKKEEKE